MNLHDIFTKFPKNFPLPMVMDGATGTSLMKLGMPKGVCTEKWAHDHPKAVRELHQGYLDAGSDMICTTTFGANPPTLLRHGVEGCHDLNCELCRMASPIKENGRVLAGNMSPTGWLLEPFGDTPFEQVVAAYKEQAAAQAEGGVDLIYPETNISLSEARAAVTAIREVTDKPVFVSVTLGENGLTMSGESPLTCFLTMAELGVCAFGANCSMGPELMRKFLAPLIPYSVALGIPLIAKPNAGLPKTAPDGSQFFDLTIDKFAEGIAEMLSDGIYILGGCCGTGADYIRGVRKVVDAWDGNGPSCEPADISDLACCGRTVVKIDRAVAAAKALPASSSEFEDAVYDGEDEYLSAQLNSEEDLEALFGLLASLKKPIALSGDADLIARFKRPYNGVALVL